VNTVFVGKSERWSNPAMPSPTDRFLVLQAKFERAAKRLSEAKDKAERAALLAELRRILVQMDEVVNDMPAHPPNSFAASN
jgi:hypothetical protein